MNQKIIFYWNIGSQPARAAKALLDIGKIPYDLVSKNVVKQQTRSKQYLGLNPLGQIPFLVHGNVKVGQSNAIMIYLCEIFDSIPKSFYGKTAEQRAKTNQYLSWYQYFFRPALFKIIKIKIYGYVRKNKTFKLYQIKSAEKQMFQAIKTLQQLLKISNSKFICGEEPTIADLLIYFELTNIHYYGENIDEYKFVKKWYNNVQSIPEVKKITDEWFPLSKQFAKIINSIKAEEEPKSNL